ncbi:hypothetical protein O181_021153 [Austropuccinia psidii MF-1]|uniref:Uncharacterized protein n=1 Tax=Austropuccinia psidii MF-1 TaxID=1389203 RepID=A0A9Q3CED0_9BASI|nr:hypothetical protein [Austropuccinia psidii MF-1]
MPVQHSPPAKNTRLQRHQAVLTPKARAPLDYTPSVQQQSANLDRGPPMKGEAPSRTGAFPKGLEAHQGEDSEQTEGTAAPEASEALNIANSNQPLGSQAEPNFLKMMEQMT